MRPGVPPNCWGGSRAASRALGGRRLRDGPGGLGTLRAAGKEKAGHHELGGAVDEERTPRPGGKVVVEGLAAAAGAAEEAHVEVEGEVDGDDGRGVGDAQEGGGDEVAQGGPVAADDQVVDGAADNLEV